MKLISLVFFILFSIQYTMAQNSTRKDESSKRCEYYETAIERRISNLDNLTASIKEEESYLRGMERSLSNTRDALEYLVTRCEDYNRSCDSTNRKIDQYNDDKRYFNNKVKQLNRMIEEYNEAYGQAQSLEEEYQEIKEDCTISRYIQRALED